MASIQDVVNAAYRIQECTKELQRRTLSCADLLKTHSDRLLQTVRGSRSGEEAVERVREAERSTRESAAQLLRLETIVTGFIRDISK